MKYTVPWGKEALSIDLPDDWDVKILESKETPPVIDNIEEEMRKQLKDPIGAEPFAEILQDIKKTNGNIAIVVDDRTRPTPVASDTIPLVKILEEHNIDLDKVKLFVANGIHRLMEDEEIKERVGAEVFNKIECLNHDADDLNSLKDMGTSPNGVPVVINKYVAEADLVISISTIESHGQAGFGGGLKNIIPGVAGRQTIGETHHMKHLSLERMAEAGTKKDQNKMRQLIDETAQFATKRVFLINTQIDPSRGVINLICGDPIEGHQKGVEFIRNIYGHDLSKKADLLITNSAPLEADFRAGTKCMSNSLNGAKEGGVILNLIKAREGLGDVTLPDISKIKGFLMRHLPMKILVKKVNESAGSPDQSGGFLDLMKMVRNFDAYIYSPSLGSIEPIENIGFEMYTDLDQVMSEVKKDVEKSSKGTPKVVIMPYGAVTFPFP
ncbi:MAG: nickel-dependent lactate racemase [Promethearchaeia archaeon]